MEDNKRFVQVTIDRTSNKDYQTLVKVDVDTKTGDLRFRLSDGFLYDSKKKNLLFEDTDPVMEKRTDEAVMLSLMVAQQHPEVFRNVESLFNEVTPDEQSDMTLIVK